MLDASLWLHLWEWCRDWYSETKYFQSRSADPTGLGAGSSQMFRGGSWRDPDANLRSANRSLTSPVNRNSVLGFRFVRTLN